MSEAWRTQWHRVPKYYPSASRPFFPRGDRISVRSFESMLYKVKDQIFDAFSAIRYSPHRSNILLGNQSVVEVKNLSTYLYENCIHPEMFAKTLELIMQNPERLLKAQLRKLGRYNLADVNKKQNVDLFTEIGRDFMLFIGKNEAEQLDILERMGVITLKPAPLPVEPPTMVIPKFKLSEKLAGLIQLTRLPSDLFEFERFSFDTAGLTENEIKRAVELFLEPENLGLAASNARIMRGLGGTELSVKFHKTEEGIVAEFKAKGTSHFIDSASITLIPRPKQGTLCT